MTGQSRRGEGGTALVEFTWLAILLMVPLLYVVVAVFEVQAAAFGVSSAARSAGRAYVQAPSELDAPRHARIAADVSLGDQGLAGERSTMKVSCAPQPGNCLAPGSVVRVEVAASVPLPLVPDFVAEDRPSVRIAAVHTVPYGSYREDRP